MLTTGITLKPLKEIENLSVLEKKEYYKSAREFCEKRNKQIPFNLFARRIIYIIGIILRRYKLEIRGVENIPKDNSVIFVCNHSNSHDFFTLTEAFVKLRMKVTPLAALDGLNWLSNLAFKMMNCTFIERKSSNSKKWVNSVFAIVSFMELVRLFLQNQLGIYTQPIPCFR